MSVSTYAERLVVAVSRRSGDEIHPWSPNGDLRPEADIAANLKTESYVHQRK
jgi:hypothetical protein